MFADTSEKQLTALEWNQSRLLAGLIPTGSCYSVEPAGKVTVLFDTDLQQVYSDLPAPVSVMFIFLQFRSDFDASAGDSAAGASTRARSATATAGFGTAGGDVTIVTSLILNRYRRRRQWRRRRTFRRRS